MMKLKIIWFCFGFTSAIILLATIGYMRNRPRDVTANMPKEQKEGMALMTPWVKSAKSGKIGPFVFFVPSNSSQKAEAILPRQLNISI
jgi:hypothetical protein